MFNRLILHGWLVFASGVLAGCGNKGELFIPEDALLPQQLEAVGSLLDESVPAAAEDDATTDKKRLPVKP